LSDNFGHAFGITFLDAEGQRQHAFSTSWGLSARTIGAVVMVHGDDSGLRMPPRVAPIQVVIVPIWRRADERAGVETYVEALIASLSPGVRVHVDRRDDKTPGWKFNAWELRGVPIRIEVGPRDVQNQQAVLVRRDTREKRVIPIGAVAAEVEEVLEDIQRSLFNEANRRLTEHTVAVTTLDDLHERASSNAGFSLAGWCESAECEARVKAESRATIRCLPFEQPSVYGDCIVCAKAASVTAVFARAY
jgi:prolyl-tRNA synthetase